MNKRKRENQGASGRSASHLAHDAADFTHQYIHEDATENNDHNVEFAAVLAQHGGIMPGDGGHSHAQNTSQTLRSRSGDTGASPYHTMTVPQPTEQAFLHQRNENGERAAHASIEHPQQHHGSGYGADVDYAGLKDPQNPANGAGSPITTTISSGTKPAVGSDEWHKVRKDNHKEVERRRRETINEGINELAKIVPGCEKNKGSILARAVQFITQLKDNESSNIEKWNLEKMLTEQAIAELSSTCDKLKAECSRAWSELEQWKKAAQGAGISIDTSDKLGPDASK